MKKDLVLAGVGAVVGIGALRAFVECLMEAPAMTVVAVLSAVAAVHVGKWRVARWL